LKEQLELLVKLQNFDLNILRAQRIKEENPQRINQLEETLEKERKELQSIEKQLEEVKKKRIGKEQDLAVAEEQIRRTKKRLTSVKTNKEYQAALKEIEVIENQKSKLEEEILIFMEQYDQIKRNLEKIEDHFNLTIKKTEEKKIELQKNIEECIKAIEEQQKMREELLPKIESKLFSQYQRIKQKRTEPIVVPVEDSCCQGCHVNIPPQLFNEVKKCKTIIKCPYCGRFLYWEKSFLTNLALDK